MGGRSRACSRRPSEVLRQLRRVEDLLTREPSGPVRVTEPRRRTGRLQNLAPTTWASNASYPPGARRRWSTSGVRGSEKRSQLGGLTTGSRRLATARPDVRWRSGLVFEHVTAHTPGHTALREEQSDASALWVDLRGAVTEGRPARSENGLRSVPGRAPKSEAVSEQVSDRGRHDVRCGLLGRSHDHDARGTSSCNEVPEPDRKGVPGLAILLYVEGELVNDDDHEDGTTIRKSPQRADIRNSHFFSSVSSCLVRPVSHVGAGLQGGSPASQHAARFHLNASALQFDPQVTVGSFGGQILVGVHQWSL